ncbi:hypothetical protein CWI37_1047p0020 [Hamiltosporidium tvaerminnensis]|uniref:Uncharacterized protein n=1 Tax=Hamiltosporidium tvaerminnensis TaxID=1176355 RepID=A0A4Q9KZ52_9MICR|nr:hypothetical protein CWI37_1047p0020 [Hamiltosporidium tvaerminnensis]
MHLFLFLFFLISLCFGSMSEDPKTDNEACHSKRDTSDSGKKNKSEYNISKDFHLIVMTDYQDAIDTISLKVPGLKDILRSYLEKMEDLILECINKTLNKQIEILKKPDNPNIFKSKIYETFYLDFIENLIFDLSSLTEKSFYSKEDLYDFKKTVGGVFKQIKHKIHCEMPYDIARIKAANKAHVYNETKKEALKLVSNIGKNNDTKKILIEKSFEIFKSSLYLLNKEILGSLFFKSKINDDFINKEVENNKFLKNIRTMHEKNGWPIPNYYTMSPLQKNKEVFDLFFEMLFKFMTEYYFNKMFPDIFTHKRLFLLWAHNGSEPGVPLSIKIRDNSFLPVVFYDREREYLDLAFNVSFCRNLYLYFYFRIEEWLFIFIEQLLFCVGKEKFVEIMKMDLPADIVERRKQTNTVFEKIYKDRKIFCGEIKSFLIKFMIFFRYYTYVSFCIYKVQDIDLSDISNKFFKKHLKNKFNSEHEEVRFISKMKEIVLIYFMNFFELKVEECFGDDCVKEKMVYWNH